MAELFEPTHIRSLELTNRFMRSATWTGVGDARGYVTDRAIDLYRELGAGGIGLIITGYQHVMRNGQQTPFMIGNYEDGQIEGLRRLAATVHRQGGKIVGQLAHSGARANPELFREDGELWGPSAVRDEATGNVPKEMTQGDITALVRAYAGAARRSAVAGFDGVQLHAAHGYGITQFLSPVWNKRGDRYGGSLLNRYRFLAEVLEAIKAEVRVDFPVLVKLNLHDYMEGGPQPDEMLQVCRWLTVDGIDAIEVTGGTASSPKEKRPLRKNIRTTTDEAYFAAFAAVVKETVNVPVITVGGIRSLGVIKAVLARKSADYVGLSRPFIREPHLINRWKGGDTRRAACISCGLCYHAAMEGKGIHCVEERRLQRRQKALDLKAAAR